MKELAGIINTLSTVDSPVGMLLIDQELWDAMN
jgi:hypothetical protein